MKMYSILCHSWALLASVRIVSGQHTKFVPAKQGCSMAHCDSQLSDQSNMLVPENLSSDGDVEVLWTDADPVGSIYMLGCASNGREVACSFGPLGKGPYLKVYTGDGQIRWSYDGLGRLSSISAPMIDNRGRVVACDSQKIVMLDNDGTLLWEVPMPGGFPISPVVTETGLVIVTTQAGNVLVVDSVSGKPVGDLQLADTIDGKQGVFATRNTPCIQGNRVYTVNEFHPNTGRDRTRTGRVFAIDIDPSNSDSPFEIAWTLDFGAPTGGSPTLVNGILVFDGGNVEPGVRFDEGPHMLGVEDMGTYAQFAFMTPVTGKVRGSASADPFGRGVWFSVANDGPLSLLTLEGKIVETIDSRDYEPVLGARKVSIATFGWSSSTGNPVVMFSAGTFLGLVKEFFHVGIDVITKELVFWSRIGGGFQGDSWSTCQSSTVLDSRGEPVIVISTAGDGVVALGRSRSSS